MLGNPRELIELDVFTTLQAMTIAAGYSLPRDFLTYDRQIKTFDQYTRFPVLQVQAEEYDTEVKTGGFYEDLLPIRVNVLFEAEHGYVAATIANRYGMNIARALMQDRRRGGYADTTYVSKPSTPAALLEAGPLFAVQVRVTVLYEYDVLAPVLTA